MPSRPTGSSACDITTQMEIGLIGYEQIVQHLAIFIMILKFMATTNANPLILGTHVLHYNKVVGTKVKSQM